MFANLHLKIAVLAMVAFGLMLMGGTVSADPDPDCVPPGSNDSAGPTLSATSHCVHTVATVGGSASNSPVVENKWELPDMDPSLAGVQYIDQKVGTDPCVVDPGTGLYTNTPCIHFDGNDIPNKNTLQHGHFHHDADPCKFGASGCQLTVTPNVDDKPEKRIVEIWAIVSDDTGGIGAIASVQAIVTQSDGVKKDTVPTHPVQLVKQSCEDLFGPELDPANPAPVGENNGNTPLHAAVNTGGLLHDKLVFDDCDQSEWAVYSGYFLLNNNQPWGKYSVCVQAFDTSSNLGELCNQFLVQNVVAFKMDFASVNFGAIAAGIPKTVSPGNIENTGNADACLSVLFGQMEGKLHQGHITSFGAELKGEALPASADSKVQFATVIPSKVINKLEFTINPPSPLAPDTYQGRVDLAVKKCES